MISYQTFSELYKLIYEVNSRTTGGVMWNGKGIFCRPTGINSWEIICRKNNRHPVEWYITHQSLFINNKTRQKIFLSGDKKTIKNALMFVKMKYG